MDPTTGAKTKSRTELGGGCICEKAWAFQGNKCENNLGCCHPDDDPGGPWCYVVGRKCLGTMDYDFCPSTKTGEKWTATQTTSFKALGDHNSCRNPDRDSGKIWCYVSDKKWEYCEPFGTVRLENRQTAVMLSDTVIVPVCLPLLTAVVAINFAAYCCRCAWVVCVLHLPQQSSVVRPTTECQTRSACHARRAP